MNRKLTAAITIAIFALSSVAILAPVAAHSTLGNYTPAYPYHSGDFDVHVSGPTGYVFPGSGLAAFTGAPNAFPPGYQNPYSLNPPGLPSSDYQLAGTAYAPFGAVLTDSEGSLIFALNFTCPTGTPVADLRAAAAGCGVAVTSPIHLRGDLFFNGLSLYIPPEFDLSQAAANIGLVSSTFSEQFDMGPVAKVSMTDPYAPGWWNVFFEGNIHFMARHNYMEWYYIKINGVKAPSIAGKYFFKMFLLDAGGTNVPGQWNTAINNPYNEFTGDPEPFLGAGIPFLGDTSECVPSVGATGVCKIGYGPTALTVPTQNWPVLLVKGEIDPGIVTGTIRYGGYNQSLYSRPINEAGMVDMIGTANDPYTGASTGRAVEARGYFNQSATGHYEVEGVAAGVYTIYAEAAGYPTQVIAQNVTILPGQSFHLDGYLNPGPVIHGQVYSKHLFGEEPWPTQPRPIFVDIYKSNTYSDDQIVAWSPWNKTHAPYMAYDWPQPDAGSPFPGRVEEGALGLLPGGFPPAIYLPYGSFGAPTPLPVAFPWDTTAYESGIDLTAPNPYVLSYYQQSFPTPPPSPDYNSHIPLTCGGTTDVCSKPDGVGPAQYWWVDAGGVFTNGGGSNSFIYQFGVKGVYGAPTDMDGHVPQPQATWINGLTPGRYWVRAWLNGYVQTLQDGVTLDEYYFDVAANEWAGDIFMPMDLRVSSSIVKTVHFHDLPGTLQECPIDGCLGNNAVGQSAGNRYLIAEVRDSNNALVGMNFTYVSGDNSSAVISINGLGMMGPDNGYAGEVFSPVFSPFNASTGMKYSYYYYCLLNGACADSPSFGHDYGLPSGTYTVYTYMRGYVQQAFESVSVTLSGSPAAISNHLYRGARFNITLYSIDWEHPTISRHWEFTGARLRVYIMDQNGLSYLHVGNRNQPGCIATGPPIGGNCNIDYVAYKDTTVDHCRIIEFDGYQYADLGGPDGDSLVGQVIPIEEGTEYWPTAFLLSTTYYRRSASHNFAPVSGIESGTYTFYAFTYGYIQYQFPQVYVQKGGFADIRIQLLEGVNLTLNIPFKTEGIYTPTTENMTMRVRVFDDNGYLVGTADTAIPDTLEATNVGPNLYNARCSLTGGPVTCLGGVGGTYYVDPFVPNNETALTTGPVDPATTGDTFLWYGTYNGFPSDAWWAFDSSTNGLGQSFGRFNPNDGSWWSWIPAGTKQVQVKIAGVYDYCGDPLNGCWSGILTSKNPYAPNPDFNSFFYMGLNGYSATIPNSYTGSYTVEVDFMNIYPNATFTGKEFGIVLATGISVLGFSPDTLLPVGMPDPTNWYPPVVGLLEGDSFHTHTFTGSSLALNGLGPYAQRGPWVLPNAHLGAEASGVFEVDKRGYISGNIYGFTYSNELRTISWASVTAVGANATFTASSWDGFYGMYLEPGSYSFTIAMPGYNSVSSAVTISSGQATSGVTFQLERSNIPVPEFTGLAVVAFSALAASVYLLRRRRQ